MSGVFRKFFGIEIKRKEKSRAEETAGEKKSASTKAKEAKHEDAKRRWEYDMRSIREALHKLDEGMDFEAVLAELNSDPLLSKPVDAEMLHRLADNQRRLQK